jgi:hypothetical protein
MINFLFLPLSSMYNICYIDKTLEKAQMDCHSDYMNRSNFCPSMPKRTEEKIKSFIKDELKVNPDKIKIFLSVINDLGGVSAHGCVESDIGILAFSRDFCNEIEKDFTKRHKFRIAQLGHLHKKDICDGDVKKTRYANWISLGAYSVTVSVSSILFPMGTFCTHLLGCTAAKVASFYC